MLRNELLKYNKIIFHSIHLLISVCRPSKIDKNICKITYICSVKSYSSLHTSIIFSNQRIETNQCLCMVKGYFGLLK